MEVPELPLSESEKHQIRIQTQTGSHDKRGEEGFLYRAELERGSVFAKQWYRQNTDGVRPGLMLMTETPGAILTPYFHDCVETSYALIHRHFPDCTINVFDGFDDRIVRGGAGASFDCLRTRPITVSREVLPGDIEKSTQLEALYQEFYQTNLKRVQFLREKMKGVPPNDPEIMAARKQFDLDVQAIVGDSIRLLEGNERKTIDGIISFLGRNNPKGNSMRDLLEAGVLPVHPEVNFIPGDTTSHPKAPHGTFIELEIVDLPRFVRTTSKKIKSSTERRKTDDGVRKLKISKQMDDLFYYMVFDPAYGTEVEWKFDPSVQTAAFRACEAFRRLHEQGKPLKDEDTFGSLLGEIQTGIKSILVATVRNPELRRRKIIEILSTIEQFAPQL